MSPDKQKHCQRRKLPQAHPSCSWDQFQPMFPLAFLVIQTIVLCPSWCIKPCFQVPEESTKTFSSTKGILQSTENLWDRQKREQHTRLTPQYAFTRTWVHWKLCSLSPGLGVWLPVLQAGCAVVLLQAGITLPWKRTWNNVSSLCRAPPQFPQELPINSISWSCTFAVLTDPVDPDHGCGGWGVPYCPWKQSAPGAGAYTLIAVHSPACWSPGQAIRVAHHKWVMLLSFRSSSQVGTEPRHNCSWHKPSYIFSTGASWRTDCCLLKDKTMSQLIHRKLNFTFIHPKITGLFVPKLYFSIIFHSLQFSIQHRAQKPITGDSENLPGSSISEQVSL